MCEWSTNAEFVVVAESVKPERWARGKAHPCGHHTASIRTASEDHAIPPTTKSMGSLHNPHPTLPPAIHPNTRRMIRKDPPPIYPAKATPRHPSGDPRICTDGSCRSWFLKCRPSDRGEVSEPVTPRVGTPSHPPPPAPQGEPPAAPGPRVPCGVRRPPPHPRGPRGAGHHPGGWCSQEKGQAPNPLGRRVGGRCASEEREDPFGGRGGGRGSPRIR